MIVDKLKYLQGYVRVSLSGYAPERFLNLCSNRNILIWNLEYCQDHYEFCVSVKGFRQLKPLLRKTKTRLRITKRYGLPFLFYRYRKRKLFACGVLLCMLVLYGMSLFIWSIEIRGNQHRTDTAILKFLEEHDIYHGMPKSRMDCAAAEELLRSGFNDIIWASVQIRGTQMIIEIQENLVTNQTTEKDSQEQCPSDLVAAKDATVYSILTRAGTPMVEKGAQVKCGDLLVSGILPIPDDSGEIAAYQYCCSDAEILGITEYTYRDVFSLTYTDKIFTGQKDITYAVRIFQKTFSLPWKKKDFAKFDTLTSEYPLKIGANFYLPITLCKKERREYELEKKNHTRESAKKIAEEKLNEFCEKLEQKGVQIIENHVIIETENQRCIAAGTIVTLESIGRRQETAVNFMQQEGQIADELDRNEN